MSFLIETLELDNVSQSYSEENVLSQLCFKWEGRARVFVENKAGRGTSTLLELLAALKPIQQGRLLINGQDVSQQSFHEFLPFRLKIGFAFDQGGLLSNQSLLENLSLPLLYHKIYEPRKALTVCKDYLNQFGLMKERDKRPAYLNQSTRKLAMFIRSLLLQPELLILDDPGTGITLSQLEHCVQLVAQNLESQSLRFLFVADKNFEVWSPLILEKLHLCSDGAVLTPKESVLREAL